MAIKISGTTVIDDSRNITNAVGITASGTISGNGSGLTTLDAGSVSTGTLAVARGGSGQSTYTDGQLLIGNSTGSTVAKATLTGTSNRVTVTNGSGSITLSGPQDIGTSSSVQFGSFGVGTAASGTTGEIRATNNVTAFYSDARLKDFKGVIDNALEKVNSLNGYYFTANEAAAEFGYNQKMQVGVSAQEVEAILPEIVTAAPFDIGQDAEGNEYSISGLNYKTVYYDKLVPLLIEAIKELKTEVETLKTEISNG
jgi:hypothetical protein